MKSFLQSFPLQTQDDVLNFFQEAIVYRETHKSESEEIARFVFDATHRTKINVPLSTELEKIRYEFGALEAPGQPEDNSDPNIFVDHLWSRLHLITKKISNRGRVH